MVDKTPLDWFIRDYARQIQECGLAIAALKGQDRDEKAEAELRDQRALLSGLIAGMLAAIDASD